MKLVDILARELTEWAGDVGAITQDKLTGELLDYYHYPLRGGNEREASSIADDAGEASDGASGAAVTRAEWQAAVDALNAPKVKPALNYGELFDECGYLTSVSLHQPWVVRSYRPEAKPEWSEDGLPNIGTKCVIYKGSYDLHADADKFIGPVVTVAARFKSACGIEMACVDSGGDLGCHVFRADMCFHLPTAEEIAFREREDAIEEMMSVAGMGSRKACTALYDRNYRKQVTK